MFYDIGHQRLWFGFTPFGAGLEIINVCVEKDSFKFCLFNFYFEYEWDLSWMNYFKGKPEGEYLDYPKWMVERK